MEQRKTKIQTLVICSVMVALSVALSFFTLWEMPMGGSVTPASESNLPNHIVVLCPFFGIILPSLFENLWIFDV